MERVWEELKKSKLRLSKSEVKLRAKLKKYH
jgi:hypothetical protein